MTPRSSSCLREPSIAWELRVYAGLRGAGAAAPPIIRVVPTHLRPTADIAADAILTGDPKRAMELATTLFDRPLMSNLSRGLWGYHGRLDSGCELTVQSAGLGGPSTAIVLEELASLGVRRAIRIGTCTALVPELAAGELLVAEQALSADGTSSRLLAQAVARPHAHLTAALQAATGGRLGLVASSDLHYDPRAAERRSGWRTSGAVAVDLSTATVFALGSRLGVEVACALVVAETHAGERAGEPLVDEGSAQLAEAAATVLSSRGAG